MLVLAGLAETSVLCQPTAKAQLSNQVCCWVGRSVSIRQQRQQHHNTARQHSYCTIIHNGRSRASFHFCSPRVLVASVSIPPPPPPPTRCFLCGDASHPSSLRSGLPLSEPSSAVKKNKNKQTTNACRRTLPLMRCNCLLRCVDA